MRGSTRGERADGSERMCPNLTVANRTFAIDAGASGSSAIASHSSQLIVGNAAIVAVAAPVIVAVAAAAAAIIPAEPVNQADIDTEPEDWRK